MPDGSTILTSSVALPRVWVMMGRKAGDNSQVMALAEAIGWPFEIKRFVYQPYELFTNLFFGPTLAGTKREECSELSPPWPDLIISAGRRNEPICRWIQKQARKEKHVRLVHAGRPWAKIKRFDLVVTTPQYRLPERPNVLHNQTPLHRVTRDRLFAEAGAWAGEFAHLPKPLIAVVVGGSSGPFSFDHAAAERLARQASALAAEKGGSLIITTSARTPAATIDTLIKHISVPSYVYRWAPNASKNPYFGMLTLAESIIVTGDSMSMLTEACATRKPVHIFDLGVGRSAMCEETRTAADKLAKAVRRPWWRIEAANVKACWYRQVMRFGPERMSRDIRLIHRHLVDSGRAVWLGDPFPKTIALPPLECVPKAANAVHRLFAEELAEAASACESFGEPMPLRKIA